MKVKYPIGYYKVVRVSFNHELTSADKKRVKDIIKYWSNISFVGDAAPVFSFLKTRVSFPVYEILSSSHAPRQRKPLELLAQYLTEGTPERQTMKWTRACQPPRVSVRAVEAY